MSHNTVLCWNPSFACAYPLKSALWVRSYRAKRVDQHIIIQMELAPGRENFERLEVRMPDGSRQSGLRIDASFNVHDQPTTHTWNLVPFFTNGPDKPVELKLAFYPSSFYASSGLDKHPDVITLHTSPNLPLQKPFDETIASMEVTTEDRSFAANTWGHLLPETPEDDYQRACRLAHAIGAELEPFDGIPSRDLMQSTPFEQYRKLTSGQERGYCENWAMITVAACLAFDIPARTVWLTHPLQQEETFLFQHGSCHLTTEIFDHKRNQWIWLDNRYNAMGAWLGSEGPLNLAEFCLFLNQPHRRPKLQLAIQTPDMQHPVMTPLDECPRKDFWCFDTWGRRIDYRPFNPLSKSINAL